MVPIIPLKLIINPQEVYSREQWLIDLVFPFSFWLWSSTVYKTSRENNKRYKFIEKHDTEESTWSLKRSSVIYEAKQTVTSQYNVITDDEYELLRWLKLV